MKPRKTTVLMLVCAALLATSGVARAAGSALQNLESEDRAKVIKEKVKRRTDENARQKRFGQNDSPQTDECGNQSIGNVSTTGRGQAPRENTTIIVGDVFNIVDGNCK